MLDQASGGKTSWYAPAYLANRLNRSSMSAKPRSVVNVGGFTAGQKQFFEYHRDMVLLKTKLNKDERPPVPRRALSKMPSSQAGRRRFDPGLPLFVSRAYP